MVKRNILGVCDELWKMKLIVHWCKIDIGCYNFLQFWSTNFLEYENLVAELKEVPLCNPDSRIKNEQGTTFTRWFLFKTFGKFFFWNTEKLARRILNNHVYVSNLGPLSALFFFFLLRRGKEKGTIIRSTPTEYGTWLLSSSNWLHRNFYKNKKHRRIRDS